ncbi:hypothetical protein P4126_33015 [Pseudomonas aeruginosa]|nr:hypothetical protein [Pseudomonas aeruginosa]
MNTTLEALMQGANYTSTPPAPSPLDALLPADLQEFYRKYGQTTFYPGAPYSFTVQQADQLERADLYVVGEDIGDELSEFWYVVATCDDQAISIDLRPGETLATATTRYGTATRPPMTRPWWPAPLPSCCRESWPTAAAACSGSTATTEPQA